VPSLLGVKLLFLDVELLLLEVELLFLEVELPLLEVELLLLDVELLLLDVRCYCLTTSRCRAIPLPIRNDARSSGPDPPRTTETQ
jgi:hypothetical protein